MKKAGSFRYRRGTFLFLFLVSLFSFFINNAKNSSGGDNNDNCNGSDSKDFNINREMHKEYDNNNHLTNDDSNGGFDNDNKHD